MTNLFYFAYGSNMDTKQMRKRCRRASVVGKASIRDKRLVWNKISQDGSGKANIVDSNGDVVWGIVYNIDDSELSELDKFEGGYTRSYLSVEIDDREEIKAAVYSTTEKIDNSLQPYEWYKARIVKGAREHGLPKEYIEFLDSQPAQPDK